MLKDELGTRLRDTRERLDLSRDDVVLMGQKAFSRSTLQQWEGGVTEPSVSSLKTLAQIYNVSPQYLIFGDDSQPIKIDDTPTNNDEYCYVPYYRDIIASAGGGKFSDGVIGTDDFLAFRKEWISRTNLTISTLVALNTDGDSMLPTIPENATILVDKSKNVAKDGRIYVVRIDDRLYIKRTQWIPTGGLRLISDNSVYESFDINRYDLEHGNIQIYGQVVHISYDLPH